MTSSSCQLKSNVKDGNKQLCNNYGLQIQIIFSWNTCDNIHSRTEVFNTINFILH